MSEENCVSIEIIKKIPFFGEGDTLVNRLKNVSLRGFPNVKIYDKSDFESVFLTKEEVKRTLHIPQPNVYKTLLNRVCSLYKLFLEKGIDILNLDYAYDFISTSESGERKHWTMIPPIVEQFRIPKTSDGKFDYFSILGPELKEVMLKKGYKLNLEVSQMNHTQDNEIFNEINDGSHRVHYAIENTFGIRIILIKNVTPGFPYYSLPLDYSKVTLMEKREESAKETKIHIIEPPGHKELYRLFPSGGIMTGEVRSDNKLKNSPSIKLENSTETKIFTRPSWEEYFMLQTLLISSRSSCRHLKTGTVIVKDKRIIASGYNGAPPGIENCLNRGCRKDEHGVNFDDKEKSVCRGIHAEVNALSQVARKDLIGATLYTLYLPCSVCAKNIAGSGITSIIYMKEYKEADTLTKEMFAEAGISLRKLNLDLDKLDLLKNLIRR